MARLLVLLFFAFAGQAFGFGTVIIDAGHGGHDRGGISRYRTPEKTITLDVARRLDKILRAKGVKTVMTRKRDVYVSLQRRVDVANARRNSLLVSIHFNSAPRRGACGYETFYMSAASGRIAARIQKQLMRTHRTENRGTKWRSFYVLRRTRNLAVLVECGFLTNRREAALCRSAAHRQRIAEAIARGILASR